MTLGSDSSSDLSSDSSGPPPDHRRPSGTGRAPANRGLQVAAGVCLLIPLVALLWVSSYNRETPELFGFPFFFWYQFAWVFGCAALTYAAYRLVLASRPDERPSK